MGDDGNWCLIESDPGVFCELMKNFGVAGLECEEFYDLNCRDSVSDAIGLIFLFKWDKDLAAKASSEAKEENDIFFARQVINNACATQALINLLMNIKVPGVELGSKLEEFRSFVISFDSQMKGHALSNAEEIRTVHNSFAGYHGFELEDFKRKKAQESYHFVAYVPINGSLYELDGLQEGPINHGKVPDGTMWLDHAVPVIQSRMAKCLNGNFNLMAVVPDRLQMYTDQLSKATSSNPSSAFVEELKHNIEFEKKKKALYRQENIQRRHNYLPLIVELLKLLGESGTLVDLIQKAKDESQAKQAKSSSVTKV